MKDILLLLNGMIHKLLWSGDTSFYFIQKITVLKW